MIFVEGVVIDRRTACLDVVWGVGRGRFGKLS
jgi:hypothetical protein